MKFRNTTLVLAGIAALALAAPAGANSVHQPARTASGNGVLCSATDPNTNPCQSLTNNPIPDTNLFETSDGAGASFYDIFSVPGIAAGTDVTFTFATTPPDGDFGAFLCDNFVTGAAGSAFSADGIFMSNACTGLAPGSTDITGLVGGNAVTTWDFTGNGGVSTWYFFALANSAGDSAYLPTSVTVTQGGSTSMPEPGILAMLGVGLIGLAALRFRG
ncbi:MAG TPA: PEP-CTERM sorting domain-containing protein [Candidatus Acidoferrales bacterium]